MGFAFKNELWNNVFVRRQFERGVLSRLFIGD
ncbi:hypothetical protein Rleg_4935 (plasmid) [Rhizobium leguminosarum bv. trifolii WSM1325]|uniref:Uncharacterized protein n=1 Tax=Rhizobium leguminosarum bv. trifolii (strain WSM1325) TaxID=395491 RepID=C6B4Z5_RHILS|nr:hypothetical protein Rleg_4935 [Rhizobium leguminosarum bv. trifolii WSM1325]